MFFSSLDSLKWRILSQPTKIGSGKIKKIFIFSSSELLLLWVLALATFFLSFSQVFFSSSKHKFALFDPTFHILEGIVANILSSLPVSLDQKNLSHRVPYELSNSNMGCFHITALGKIGWKLTDSWKQKTSLDSFCQSLKYKIKHARCYKKMCPLDYENNINMWVEKALYSSLVKWMIFVLVRKILDIWIIFKFIP